MKTLMKSLLITATLAISSTANAIVITNLGDATNNGQFFGTVSFANSGANTVLVTADISTPINATLTRGDILGLWFDFANFGGLTGSPTFGGSTAVISSQFSENSVGTSLGGNVNINGSGQDNWDLAVEVGQNGGAGGFVQTLDFTISIAGLDESQFIGQRVGMRVQSISGTTGFFEEDGTTIGTSSKLIGINGSNPPPPVPPVPEPASLSLLSLGLLGLGALRRNRRKS